MTKILDSALSEYRLSDWSIKVQLGSKADADIIRVIQEHGARIVASGSEGPADGIYTDSVGAPIGISTADCVPLIVVTPNNALALHVSRKTLNAGQLDQVPQIFNIAAITGVFIGPHICPQHFIFEYAGPEILAFAKRWPEAVAKIEAGTSLNLDRVVTGYLNAWHVPDEDIMRVSICTAETPQLPSYCRSRIAEEKLEDSIITSVRHLQQTV